MTPIVQIVHYSDLHIVGPDYLQQRTFLDRISRRLPTLHRQGLSKASLAALQAFEAFLRDDIAGDDLWQGRPVWLIDTGDGTTFGDAPSLEQWIDVWSPRFLKAAGHHARQLTLYGNHDAWPGTFPLLAPRGMAPQRDALRATRFADAWPAAPLTAPIPSSRGSQIQLYALNSVDHELFANTKALGKVLPDRFWESPPPMTGPTALDDLRRCIAAHSGAAGGRHLRILAMHYPVCADTHAGARITEILANRDDVARELAAAPAGSPLAHLLLAGHTHVGYPSIGLLPNALGSVRHAPLPDRHCQSVAASLSQIVLGSNGAAALAHYPDQCAQDCPYQCTVLRIYAANAQGDELVVERITAGRPPGGSFAFLPLDVGSSRCGEQLTVTL